MPHLKRNLGDLSGDRSPGAQSSKTARNHCQGFTSLGNVKGPHSQELGFLTFVHLSGRQTMKTSHGSFRSCGSLYALSCG